MSAAISDTDRDFVRAVVALARERGIGSLTIEYRCSVNDMDRWNRPTVKAHWGEGRHGDQSNILIEYQASESIDEQAQHPAAKEPKS